MGVEREAVSSSSAPWMQRIAFGAGGRTGLLELSGAEVGTDREEVELRLPFRDPGRKIRRTAARFLYHFFPADMEQVGGTIGQARAGGGLRGRRGDFPAAAALKRGIECVGYEPEEFRPVADQAADILAGGGGDACDAAGRLEPPEDHGLLAAAG